MDSTDEIIAILTEIAPPRQRASGINFNVALLRNYFTNSDNPVKLLIQLLPPVPNYLLAVHEMDDEETRTRECLVLQRKIFEAFCFWIDPLPSNNNDKAKKKTVPVEQKSIQNSRNIDNVSRALSALSLEDRGSTTSCDSVCEIQTTLNKS